LEKNNLKLNSFFIERILFNRSAKRSFPGVCFLNVICLMIEYLILRLSHFFFSYLQLISFELLPASSNHFLTILLIIFKKKFTLRFYLFFLNLSKHQIFLNVFNCVYGILIFLFACFNEFFSRFRYYTFCLRVHVVRWGF